jgi:hypothetical protein
LLQKVNILISASLKLKPQSLNIRTLELFKVIGGYIRSISYIDKKIKHHGEKLNFSAKTTEIKPVSLKTVIYVLY